LSAACAVNAARNGRTARACSVDRRLGPSLHASRSRSSRRHGRVRRARQLGPRTLDRPRHGSVGGAPTGPRTLDRPAARRQTPGRQSASLTTTSRPAGRLVRRNRRRPTLPGPCEPSTIGAVGLNCSVRNGKRCFPHAIATGNLRDRAVPQNCTALPTNGISIRQALDPLVPVSCVCHHTSRSGLSTWWSTRGLTPSRGWESSSRGRLPA
jgi:hypothetical protein